MENSEDIGILFKQINDNLGRRANNELRKSGLTISQIRYLGFMYENGKERTPFKLLEKEFDVAQPTVAGIMRRLEKKGLVRTLPNEEDSRAKDASLTTSGKRVFENGKKHKKEMESLLTSGLSPQECKELRRMLMILLDSVRQT